MEMTVERRWKRDGYTIGILYVNGKRFGNGKRYCNTLEDTDRGLSSAMAVADIFKVKVHGQTAIPTGRYEVRMTYSPRFKRQLPLLVNVPSYEGVRIHSGSITVDSTMSSTSTNPVQNKVIYSALQRKQNTLTAGTGISINGNTISCTVSGDTQDWNYQLNIVLPCKTYSTAPTDADLAEMDNAMMYVGNRVILLNNSGRGISVFGRQEVEHMTTYQVTSTNKGTVVSSSAKPSLVISKGVNLDKTDGRSYSTWNGSLTDTRGYYVPTIQSDGVTVKYKYTKYWTTDESWYVPNGWFALMECVCDVDAEYALDEYSSLQPVQGQSVFWRVKVGKMLTK